MPSQDKGHIAITSSDQQLVLSSLEPEQLTGLKKHLIPRRHLNGPEKFVMWSLFMMVVVVYQVWTSGH
jgi:hypothetical protein